MKNIYNTIITIFRSALLAILLVAGAEKLSAQSVGLVLSGGGAKGLYHIGVLRALEENGIPIDYIAGTSMGSIIGGMYASGYTIEEMEEVALSGDMVRWVTGGIDGKYNYYYRERDKITDIVSLAVTTEQEGSEVDMPRLKLPGSVMGTSEIDLALCNYFTQPSAAARGDFSRLMIPFFCVATDIENHRAVELHRGNLALAIRASMAIPIAFPPVEVDSVLMCDGGCYDNFPWQAMVNNYNPDILIGVSCVASHERIDKDASVIEQAMALITAPTNFNLPEDRSVFIQRAVDASVLDFSLAKEIMAQGYNDAIAAMPKIRDLTARRIEPGMFNKRRMAFRGEWPASKMGEITVSGLRTKQQELAETALNMGHNKERDTLPLTALQMGENYLTMLANLPLASEFPIIELNRETNRYDVAVRLNTKPNFDISIGGNISSTAFNQAYFGLRYRWIGRVMQSIEADILLGPVYTMARAKGRTTFIKDKPIYLYYGYNFNITNTLKGNFGNLSNVDNAEQMRTMENYLSLSLGSALSRKSIVDATLHVGRNGYRYAMEEYEKRQYTHFSYIGSQLSVERNTFDKPLFPTAGSRFSASAIYIYGRDERNTPGDHIDAIRKWYGAKVSWEHYIDFTHQGIFSLGYALEGVYTNHPELDSKEATELSAPHYSPLLHSRMVYMPEFRADHYVGVGLMPTIRIIDNFYARLSVYAMMRDKYLGKVMHYMSDFSLIYHTPVGPVSLALTKYDFHTKNNLYLTLNIGYAIFGNKGLFY